MGILLDQVFEFEEHKKRYTYKERTAIRKELSNDIVSRFVGLKYGKISDWVNDVGTSLPPL